MASIPRILDREAGSIPVRRPTKLVALAKKERAMKANHGDTIRYKRCGDTIEHEGKVSFVGVDGGGKEFYALAHEPADLIHPLISEDEILAVVRPTKRP